MTTTNGGHQNLENGSGAMTSTEPPRYFAANTRPEFDLLRVEWIRPSAQPRQRFYEAPGHVQ